MANDKPVVTIGEPMMVFNGAPHSPVGVRSALAATFAGAESNLAIGLARLGHRVAFLSAVGHDGFGRAITRTLRGEGVDVSGVAVSRAGPTGVMFKDRRDPARPEVMYYRAGSAFSRAGPETFDPAAWQNAGLLFLTGITPALSPSCRALTMRVLQDARHHAVPVWFDPNYRRKLWDEAAFVAAVNGILPYVDTVLPGAEEARLLTGETEPAAVARVLFDRGVKKVVLKAGEAGAYAITADAQAHCERYDLGGVVDPIGAGDAFNAGYLSAFLDGVPVEDRLLRGHAVAAMVCTTHGDWEGLPTRGELERFVARRGEPDR